MRKRWPCSVCGFARRPNKSMWRNLRPLKPIICNKCRLKERKNNKAVKQSVYEEAKVNPLNESSSLSHEISPLSSIAHENVAFSVGQIGMVFGNLTFEATPVNVGGKSLEPRVKSEVLITDDDGCVIQVHKCLKPSATSTFEDSTIQFKQENEDEATLIWDNKKVQRKKRSKLPQYTLSPLARLVNQLQHVSLFRHRRRIRVRSAAAGVFPKYDDVLIYEKCNCLYVAENEVGLGAELLPPPVYESLAKTTPFVAIRESSSSPSEGSAYSVGLAVDV